MLKKVFRVVLTICGMLLGFGVSTYLVEHWDVLSGLAQTEKTLIVLVATGLFAIIFFNIFSALTSRGERVANTVAAELKVLEKLPITMRSTALNKSWRMPDRARGMAKARIFGKSRPVVISIPFFACNILITKLL